MTRNERANFGSKLAVSYTHLRAHETGRNLVCRLLLEKKKKEKKEKKKKKKKNTEEEKYRERKIP